MQKILPILLLFLLVSCQSKEEKALKLIDKQMFGALYDYDSYQVVETQIDSAYSSIYRDSTVREYAIRICSLEELVAENKKEMNSAISSMNIWSDSYSSYGRSEYRDATKKFNKNMDEAKKYIDLWGKCEDSIKIISKCFQQKFIGWQASHKFRCKSKGGHSNLATYIYVFDPKIKEILYYYDTEDELEQKIVISIDAAMQKEK